MKTFQGPQPLAELQPVLRHHQPVAGRVQRVERQTPHDRIPAFSNLRKITVRSWP